MKNVLIRNDRLKSVYKLSIFDIFDTKSSLITSWIGNSRVIYDYSNYEYLREKIKPIYLNISYLFFFTSGDHCG